MSQQFYRRSSGWTTIKCRYPFSGASIRRYVQRRFPKSTMCIRPLLSFRESSRIDDCVPFAWKVRNASWPHRRVVICRARCRLCLAPGSHSAPGLLPPQPVSATHVSIYIKIDNQVEPRYARTETGKYCDPSRADTRGAARRVAPVAGPMCSRSRSGSGGRRPRGLSRTQDPLGSLLRPRPLYSLVERSLPGVLTGKVEHSDRITGTRERISRVLRERGPTKS